MRGSCSLDRLLSPDAEVIHRTRRFLFEKRIVSLLGERRVLYRFPVPWRATKLAALLDEAERKGIPMQRYEARGTRWATADAGSWVIASYELGSMLKLSGLNAELVASLATSLARLHSIGGCRSGSLFALDRPFQTLAGKVDEDVRSALESCDVHDGAAKDEMLGWLAEHGGFLRRMKRFHLVHGDLISKNILVREGSTGVCLIDYELATFDHAGFELAAALFRFLGGGNRKYRPAFLDRYLSECDEDTRGDWMAYSHYFLVSSALRLAWTRVRRRRILTKRGEHGEASAQERRFHGYVASAFSMMKAYECGARAPEEMLSGRL